MADAVVSSAIQKIDDAIINEALFLASIEQQAEDLKRELTLLESFLQDLKRELTLMESFLRDADAKARGGNQSVQKWVKEVEEAAHDAKDLIESIAIQRSEPWMGRKRRRSDPGAHIPRDDSGMEIEELQQRIKNIRESAAGYGITALPNDLRESRTVNEATAWRRAPAPHASDSSHVLMEAEKEAILHLLDPEREKRRSVVSIVGIGGLGKTTLAKKVFKDPRIKSRFQCAFWIHVSADYMDVKLLKDLLRQIFPEDVEEYDKMEKTMLESRLYESLLRKTYLIVMDDVCDGKVCQIFEKHLPDDNNGSKVLITTRNREVADAADQATPPYELRFLNQEESWDLFLSKAIPKEEERSDCTGRLKELGEQMADKCRRLPLALVIIGGLLSQKQRSIAEWERVYESMVWQYEGEGQICLISYGDLRYDLKWCFLYLCAFPKDYQIESDRLIRLWIAEGFIAERGDGLTLEETGEIQLEKLIEGSLVHVVKPEHYEGVIRCRVHDLLRELCISEAEQIGFMSVHQGTRPLPAELSHRRLSVITKPEETISSLQSAPRLRALLGFYFDYLSLPDMNLSVEGLRLIRVIDLQGAKNLKVLPDEVGGLVNLRYLNLSRTYIQSLPETIKNLSRLQFLDVSYTKINKMTSAVWKMKTLRQVFFPTTASVPKKLGRCCWRSPQVLSLSGEGRWMDGNLHQMKDIQTLELRYIDARHHRVLSLNLPQFSRLKKLNLQGDSIPWTALTLSDLHLLRTLMLTGPVKGTFREVVRPKDITDSPRDLSSLEREGLELDYAWPAGLTYLELYNSDLHRDPLPSLGQLSELNFLKLSGTVYSWGEEMKFRRDGFKQVERIKLHLLDPFKKKLKSLTVEDGAMPRLQQLELLNLNELERVTVGAGVMPCLQKLEIYDCERLETIPQRLEDVVERT